MTIELDPDQVSRLSDSAGPAENVAAASEEAAPQSEAATVAKTETPEETAAAEEDYDPDAGGDRTDSSSTASYPGTASYHDEGTGSSAAGTGPASPAVSKGGGALAAGVAGGVIALVIAGSLQWAGLIPALGSAGDDAAVLQSLRADVDALEQKTAAFDAGTIDAETIKRALAPADKRMGELASELATMKKDIAAAQAAAVSSGSADTAGLKDAQDRLAKLEQSVAAASKAAPSTQTVDALGQKLTSLDRTAAANSDALKKLEQNISTLDGKVAAQANEPHATAAIAASALKSAIDRGGSFAAELDMFAAVAPDAPQLGELRALAARGVPTRAQLAADVAPVADRMLDATQQAAAPDSGIVDRLMASARSLVSVRPVGNVEGDSVAARIARFRNAVTGGDLARAAAEYTALPDKAKAAGADFMAGLQARLKVDALAQKALASVLKAS